MDAKRATTPTIWNRIKRIFSWVFGGQVNAQVHYDAC